MRFVDIHNGYLIAEGGTGYFIFRAGGRGKYGTNLAAVPLCGEEETEFYDDIPKEGRRDMRRVRYTAFLDDAEARDFIDRVLP